MFRLRYPTGQTVGAGDPSAAQRRETEGVRRRRKRPQADRIRNDALRNDDGRYPISTLQTTTGHGGRNDSASRQKRCSRRHPGIHPITAAPPQGLSFSISTISDLICFHYCYCKKGIREETSSVGSSRFYPGRIADGVDPPTRF